jgi:ribonuclease BN (tRNA processing enzyme)
MEVTVLGTGSPMALTAATGLVVAAPGCAPLLIDTCGGFELPRQLARAGIPLRDLRHVIATHRHLDHIGGMAALFIGTRALDIYALADTHAGIRGLMAACFPEWSLDHPALRQVAVTAGERREIAGYAVEFFAVEHRVPTLAVRVERAGRVLAFSADSVPCAGLVACARDADLFLCDALYAAGDLDPYLASGELALPPGLDLAGELMHPTARQAGEVAAQAGARALVLLHLGPWANRERVEAEARAAYPGRVVMAEDCATYPV